MPKIRPSFTSFTAVLLALIFLLAACDNEPPVLPTPTAAPATAVPDEIVVVRDADGLLRDGVALSEVLLGMPGGNSAEFVELYNAGGTAVDLDGWTLWYRLADDQDEILVHRWRGPADIPPHGHFLLVHSGQDFGLLPDAMFDEALFGGKGGLALRDADGETADSLSWGDGPDSLTRGTAVAAPEPGQSLERLPGGPDGATFDSGDNAVDWVAQDAPDPQNSGSPPTPPFDFQLAIRLEGPETVEPGQTAEFTVIIENPSGRLAEDVRFAVPVPDGFEIVSAPISNEQVARTLDAGARLTLPLTLKAPFTYANAVLRGYHAEADEFVRAYGQPQSLTVSGTVPVGTARALTGSRVTVEGVATMYTGGFFAGSGTKFYLEDESGGIQVYVPDGGGVVDVGIGDHVRVSGEIELYRDSLELVPGDPVADVTVLEPNAVSLEPAVISVEENENNPAVLGRLTQIEGTVSRVEEFNFSFEMDLADEQGNTTLVLIEKDTGVTAEPVDVGQRYRITGISEFYSGQRQIKPRLQSDIVPVFPPVLMASLSAPNSIAAAEMLTYTVTAVNHTPDSLTDLRIVVGPPDGATVTAVLDGGQLADGLLVWTAGELAGSGASLDVRFVAAADEERTEPLLAGPAVVTAEGWPEAVEAGPFLTFIGGGVPIWAIQGDGAVSPYVRGRATTQGVVTGVFPELDGFWLQELETDDDPLTSAGIFVLTGEEEATAVASGDLVRVTGRVREMSGQTTLDATAADAIAVTSTGAPLPEPVAWDPPLDPEAAQLYNESLEGMLVAIEAPAVVVGPTTQYGEYALVYERWEVDEVARTDEAGFLMFVDDGSDVAHEDQSTLPYAVQKGDVVRGVVGPLAYTFDNYKVEPLAAPDIATVERPLPSLAEPGLDQFSVATYNVENLFDLVDPHPGSPPRPTLEQYRARLDKLAQALVAMGAPTIVGLQEVENVDILEDLVALDALADFAYEPYLIEGTDSRGIDVAYLVRGDRATVEAVAAFEAPEGLTSRPPLVMTATVHLQSGDRTVVVLNNHFTSLAGGEVATEPRRTGQAAWNVELVERIRVANPDAQFIVLGDLNSFYQTPPITTLEAADLRHAYAYFAPGEPLPYTYIFEGRTQTLDHILVSDALFEDLVSVQALHIGADYPIWQPDDRSARRLSDHDPLVVVFGE